MFAFQNDLLRWYRANRRDLPWRRCENDPYAVWVSEIMLQQTQVSTVIPFFERWISRFPTIRSLAEANLEAVLRYWAGLGYYARARNLHRAARVIVDEFGGIIPSELSDLRGLPGVGRYTAGAIRSIAFNLPAPIVDANVARVLCRLFAIAGDPKSGPAQARLWETAEQLIPEGESRDFNQAMMELGALVCTPADPSCERCPLLRECVAGNSSDPTAWPQIPAGRATIRLNHSSVVLRCGSDALVVRRPSHGLWGGLWEFPRRVCEPTESPSECARRAAIEVAGVDVAIGELVATVKHSVTHHAIALHGFEGAIIAGNPAAVDCTEVRWVHVGELLNLPLSAPQRLLAEAVMARPASINCPEYLIR